MEALQPVEAGAEPSWELCKENAQPLKQGRKAGVLKESLKHTHSKWWLASYLANSLCRQLAAYV